MGVGVFGPGIMDVVGCQKTEPVTIGHFQQGFVDRCQFRDAMLLEFDKEALPAKNIHVLPHYLVSFLHVSLEDRLRDLGSQAAGGGDQAFTMTIHESAVDAGLVVISIELGGARYLEQVLVAGLVLGQEQHVKTGLVLLRVAVCHPTHRQVGFNADNGFDAFPPGGAVKGHGAIHGAVIGQGDGRLV